MHLSETQDQNRYMNPTTSNSAKTSLILSGGGARGAYQVGVLKALSEIIKPLKIENPFPLLSGTSAGAINAAKLASSEGSFHDAVSELVLLWSEISSDKVFKAEILSLKNIGLSSFFSSEKQSKFNSLLDTSPLKKLISDSCDFNQIEKNISQKKLDSLIITANNYTHSSAYSFIQTFHNLEAEDMMWAESRRKAIKTEMTVDHIMASSAIPFLFPPVTLENQPFGDGCVRNQTPTSPSIKMGADQLFIIGVRAQHKGEVTSSPLSVNHQEASMIRVMNTLLNAVLLDSVEQDVQQIMRINELLDGLEKTEVIVQNKLLRKLPLIYISPSQDIGELARKKAHHLPRILRMTINAFGDLDEASEMLSYLMFDADFCKQLISMGYADCINYKQEILQFFELAKKPA